MLFGRCPDASDGDRHAPNGQKAGRVPALCIVLDMCKLRLERFLPVSHSILREIQHSKRPAGHGKGRRADPIGLRMAVPCVAIPRA